MLKNDPSSRRIIVSGWNVGEIYDLYQRSADFFLGVPFNIASYALLTMMVAQVTGYKLGEFVWTGADIHLYLNHLEQAKLQISRENDIRPSPKMKINPEVKNIFNFKYSDFEVVDYNPLDAIKATIAV